MEDGREGRGGYRRREEKLWAIIARALPFLPHSPPPKKKFSPVPFGQPPTDLLRPNNGRLGSVGRGVSVFVCERSRGHQGGPFLQIAPLRTWPLSSTSSSPAESAVPPPPPIPHLGRTREVEEEGKTHAKAVVAIVPAAEGTTGTATGNGLGKGGIIKRGGRGWMDGKVVAVGSGKKTLA